MKDDPNHTRWDEIIPPHPDAKKCPECGCLMERRTWPATDSAPAEDSPECPIHGELDPDGEG